MCTAVANAPAASRRTNRSARYQELKGRVHQELLNRLNLERLTQMSARGRRAGDPRADRRACSSAEATTTPLSLFERETLIVDVLNELFGLGPLEALLADPTISDILVNRFDQVYVERERPARGDRHRLSRTTGT